MGVLVKQANTDAPYKNTFKIALLPTIAAAPIIKMPVPKKKHAAMDTPKYFLNMIFKKVYSDDQPKLITIFPKRAKMRERGLTSNDV